MPATVVAPTSRTAGAETGVERVRRASVPLVALLAACLGVVCLLNVTDLAGAASDLSVVSARFVGWAGVGTGAGICLVWLAVAAAPRVGAAAPLAVGTVAAVFGLALGRSVFDGVQLALAFIMLGLAVGGLLGAAVCLTLEPSLPGRLVTVVAWGLPLAAGPPLVDWLALRGSPTDSVQLTLHPPFWPLAAVSALLILWSAVTMLVEAGADRVDAAGRAPAEAAWTALVVVTVMPTVAVMLVGFQPEIGSEWLRPLVIAVAAVTVLGLGVAGLSMPSTAVQVGYVAVTLVMLCWPVSIGLLLRVSDRAGGVPGLLLAVVLTAAFAGAGAGVWRPRLGVVGGLLLLAVGAAGAWGLPSSSDVLAVPIAVLAAGAAAALLGGLRFGLVSPLGVRLVGAAAVSAAMLGVLLSLPLSWALGGNLPDSVTRAGADARVFLGLTFAAAALGAGYAATRIRGQPLR